MRKTIWGFALLVIMAFLASCSESSEYTNAIPKDAAMVVSLDFMLVQSVSPESLFDKQRILVSK